MAKSPLLQCRCVHCDNQITAAEKRRNGYACDRCLIRVAQEEEEWRNGASDEAHEKFDKGRTLH